MNSLRRKKINTLLLLILFIGYSLPVEFMDFEPIVQPASAAGTTNTNCISNCSPDTGTSATIQGSVSGFFGFGGTLLKVGTTSGGNQICQVTIVGSSASCSGTHSRGTAGSQTFYTTCTTCTSSQTTVTWSDPDDPPTNVVDTTDADPTELTASGSITITWDATDDNALTNYYIYSSTTDTTPDTGDTLVASGALSGTSDDYTLVLSTSSLTSLTYYRGRVRDSGAQFTYSATTWFSVTDTTDPVNTVAPSDVSYEAGNTDTKNIQWTATDIDPDTYIIERNFNGGAYSTVRTATAWSSGVATANYDVGSLSAGTWNHRITFDDGSGNDVSEIQTTTVSAAGDPTFTGSLPTDSTYEDGYTTTINKVWNFQDGVEGGSWTVRYKSTSFSGTCTGGTQHSTGSWSGGTTGGTGNIDVSGLSATRYYCIVITDKANNDNYDEFLVTVDTAADPVPNTPADLSFEIGTPSQTIAWTWTDNVAYNGVSESTWAVRWDTDFHATCDATQYPNLDSSGGWAGNSGNKNVDVSGVTADRYYCIIIIDNADNEGVDHVFVDVSADVAPVVSSPSNLSYENGDTRTVNLQWTFTDNFAGDSFTVRYQATTFGGTCTGGTQLDTGSWTDHGSTTSSNTGPAYNVGGLTADRYYCIVIDDFGDNTDYDEVFVDVLTSAAPSVSAEADASYESGDTRTVSRQWTFSDAIEGDDFEVRYQSTTFSGTCTGGTLLDSGSWTDHGSSTSSNTGPAYNFGGLTADRYYCIVVNDHAGNSDFDEVFIDVIASAPPFFEATPSDVQYESGNTDFRSVSWQFNDAVEGDTYTIRYQSTTFSGTCTGGTLHTGPTSWDGSTGANANVGSLTADRYYCIVVTDQAGNSAFDEVFIDIVASAAPVLSTPSDVSYENGDSDTENLQWTFTDNFEGVDFTVRYQASTFGGTCTGGTLLDSGSWTDHGTITSSNTGPAYNVGGLSADRYYCIVVTDDAGNSDFDEMFVDVVASAAPVLSAPSDVSYENGDTDTENLQWTFTDNVEGTTFEVRYQATTFSGTCTGGTLLDSGSWTDHGTITSSNTGPNYDVGSLTSDRYYCIVVNDAAGNSDFDEMFVDVLAAQAPQFTVTPSDFAYENGNTESNTATWDFTDNVEGNTWTIRYQATTFGGSCTGGTLHSGPTAWVSPESIGIEVGSLTSDRYYCIVITDHAGNSATDEVFIDVATQVNPTFTSIPTDVTYENGNTTSILWQWQFSDNFEGGTWDVRYDSTLGGACSGTLVDSGTWTGGTTGQTTNTEVGSLTATRYYCANIVDDAGHASSDTKTVTVVASANPVFTGTPSDQQYESGNTDTVNVQWDFTDNVQGNSYTIRYQATTFGGSCTGGTQLDTGSWTTPGQQIINVGSLTADRYYCIVITDTVGNSATDEVFIDVVAAADPTFTATPSDQSYEAGDPATVNVQWDFSDNYAGLNYELRYQATTFGASCTGGTLADSGSWTTPDSLIWNVGGLTSDRYYCLIIWDDANHDAMDEVFVDTTPSENPIFTGTPADQLYENGDTRTVNIQWDFTDNFAGDTWEIRYQASTFGGTCTGGSLHSSGTWTSPGQQIIDVGSLTADRYYCIRITDDATNEAQDEVFVDVVASAAPTFTGVPPDFDYESGVSSYRAARWDYSDNVEFDTYNIRWSTTAFVGDCTGGNNFIGPNSVGGNPSWSELNAGLETSDRYYCIRVTDHAGNSAWDQFFIDVAASQAPQITVNPISADDYEEGNAITRNIQWTATDSYPGTYVIQRSTNGAAWAEVRGATAWSSGVATAVYDIGSLTEAVYDFRIIFTESTVNATGKTATSSNVTVTVAANSAPVITVEPIASWDYEDGNTAVRNIQWTATDSYPDTYIIERRFNGGSWSEVRSATSWSSGVAIAVYDIGSLPVGTWEYRITFTENTANATAKNIVSTSVTLTVFANEVPQITATPIDDDYEEGNTATRNVNWTATDSYPDYYTIDRSFNGAAWVQVRVSTSWTSGVTILNYDVGSLTEGVWTFRITFFENTVNATGKSTVSGNLTITVYANVAPIITSNPVDEGYETDYEDGDPSIYNIRWSATDSYPDYYIIERSFNGGSWTEVVGSTAWSSGVFIAWYDIGSLSAGSYNFRVTFYENTVNATGKSTTSANTTLTVLVSENPEYTVVNIPLDHDASDFTTPIYLELNITDNEKDNELTITVYRSTDNSTWVYVRDYGTSLDLGDPHVFQENIGDDTQDWYYRIGVLDMAGNQIYFYAYIPLDPFIDFGFLYYSYPDLNIDDRAWFEWHIEDWNGGTFNFYRNGTTIMSGSYYAYERFDYEVSQNGTLPTGNYNFTLIAWDDASNNATSIEYLVSYTDRAPQILVAPNDQNIQEGVPYTIEWTAFDNRPETYVVYQNGSQVGSGYWSNQAEIMYTIMTYLALGDYNFTLVAQDNAGQTVSDEVIITVVVDTKEPLILEEPTNEIFATNTTENYLNWTLSDLTYGMAIVYRNGSIVYSYTWESGNNGFELNLVADSGSYFFNITVVFQDAAGLEATSSTIWIRYDPDNDGAPDLLLVPNDLNYNVGDIDNLLRWVAVDNYERTYNVTRDGQLIVTARWDSSDYIRLNVDFLLPGTYTFVIYIYDSSGNSVSDTVLVTVT